MDEKFLGLYRIPATRSKCWDYGSNGIYFITICTKNRERCFGVIEKDRMNASDLGRAVLDCWHQIPEHYSFVILDEFIVMPDHVHGILHIRNQGEGTRSNTFGPQSNNLASVIRGFKIGVTKYAKQHHISFAWQPRFYDCIIQNENALHRVRTYIINNPKNWTIT